MPSPFTTGFPVWTTRASKVYWRWTKNILGFDLIYGEQNQKPCVLSVFLARVKIVTVDIFLLLNCSLFLFLLAHRWNNFVNQHESVSSKQCECQSWVWFEWKRKQPACHELHCRQNLMSTWFVEYLTQEHVHMRDYWWVLQINPKPICSTSANCKTFWFLRSFHRSVSETTIVMS